MRQPEGIETHSFSFGTIAATIFITVEHPILEERMRITGGAGNSLRDEGFNEFLLAKAREPLAVETDQIKIIAVTRDAFVYER